MLPDVRSWISQWHKWAPPAGNFVAAAPPTGTECFHKPLCRCRAGGGTCPVLTQPFLGEGEELPRTWTLLVLPTD